MHNRALLVLALSLLGVQLASADQTHQISSYAAAGKKAYALYVDPSSSQATDIYCGLRFKVDQAHPRQAPGGMAVPRTYIRR